MLRRDGTFGAGLVRAALSVVEGSGTGSLAGLRGEGEYVAIPGEKQRPDNLRGRIDGRDV